MVQKKTHSKGRSKDVSSSEAPEILGQDDPRLRLKAKEVPMDKIGSPEIRRVIESMKQALATQADGIGLAAPQIGISLRIFIVSGRVFAPVEGFPEGRPAAISSRSKKITVAEAHAAGRSKHPAPAHADLICINPVITKESKEKKWMEGEGCLSVRWLYGKVRRSTKVTIQACDEDGRTFTRGASGLLAHIFQHEVDHLDGILFIDKAKDVQEMNEDEIWAQTHATHADKKKK